VARARSKLASTEAMLASAVGRQLEGVSLGLGNLSRALEELGVARGELEGAGAGLAAVPGLAAALAEVKEEASRHSQLATARGNLEHLVRLPEVCAAAEEQVVAGRLLAAHDALAELEAAREDLLLELHRGQAPGAESAALKGFFQPLDQLAASLEARVGEVVAGALQVVREEPALLVSALRLVEREEAMDEAAAARLQLTGFQAPGRPRGWRAMALDRLRAGVLARVAAVPREARAESKMWLVRHLELVRRAVLRDLRVAKHHLPPCWPPAYSIFQHCVGLVHEALTGAVLGLLAQGLEGTETVTMLQWVLRTFPGPELLGSPALGLLQDLIPPLLSQEEVGTG
jgi:exocyst complex component 3